MIVGYIRVSSVDQNTARQLDGIKLDKVFEEKLSAKNTDRPQLQLCLDFLKDGDTLYAYSMSTLSENLKTLLNIIMQLTVKGASISFVSEDLEFNCNDKSKIKALVLFDNANLKTLQRIGREKAKARGVKLGRAPISQGKQEDIKSRRMRGDTVKDISKKMNLSIATVYKYI